jgi:hypothetical protein
MKVIISQSKLNEIVARWANGKVDRVQEYTDAVGLPFYRIYQKNGKILMSIYFPDRDLGDLLVYFDEMFYSIYDFIPRRIGFRFFANALAEYSKNPSLRSFEMEEIDPYLNDKTNVTLRLLGNQN